MVGENQGFNPMKSPSTRILLVAFPAIILVLSSLKVTMIHALDNGLALRPPMGWLAWERFVCETNCAKYPSECIGERLFMDMAKRMAEDGFKDLGYEYVNIDDCWSYPNRNNSKLLADGERFPSSIGNLSDYMHSLGLKLGIYGDCGTKTCQNFPGQLANQTDLEGNYFNQDASSFAEWKIDSFKFDGCYLNVSRAATICPWMGVALNDTGRPMLFSCSWPAYENDEGLATDWSLVAERCNLWRAFGDIEDSWRSVTDTIDYFVRKQELVVKYHGPGHWFDADQLVIGNFGLSHEQEVSQMAIWCIWSSPLYMSNDLRALSLESSKILRNKWLIAVNQDKLGIFGLMVLTKSQVQVFAKPIEPIVAGCPSYAIVYLDRRTLGTGRSISFTIKEIVSSLHLILARATGERYKWDHCAEMNRFHDYPYLVTDLLAENTTLSKLEGYQGLNLRVNPSGVRAVKLHPVSRSSLTSDELHWQLNKSQNNDVVDNWLGYRL